MASNLRVDTILPSSGTNVAIGTASGTVSLIGDSNLTTSGNLTIGGNLGVGGTLTYEDVTNIDSVGVITARSDIHVAGDIKNGTSLIDITQNGRIEIDIAGTEIVDINGNGVDVVGGVEITGDVKIPDSIIHIGDTNTKIRFPAADTISFETAGSERLRISSVGTLTNTTTSSHSQGAGTFNIKGIINQYSQGSGSGLIFDCDFGRLTGYADNASIANSANLSAALAHSTTDWVSSSSNTPMTVNGGSFNYRVGRGGYLDCVQNEGRVSIAAGSGSPNMAETLNTASMTIESWIWYDGAGREVIVSRYGSGFPNQFNMLADPDGQFHYNGDGVGTGSGNITGQNFPDKTWHHHVWQYDSGNNVNRWYINGAFANSASAGSSLAVSDNSGFAIASRADDYERWDGKIAIVRIYNRALSATEIKNHFELDRGRFGV